MSAISGSCLCGKVTFECHDKFEQFHLCHCAQCQKISGSAHVSNLFSKPDNIKWLSGVELVKRFDVSGKYISNCFCSECGCAVPYVSGSGNALIVPAGCLDQAPSIDPQDHIFCSEKATWYEQAIDAPKFDKFPQ